MADKDFVVKNGLVVNTNLIVANNGRVGINNSTPDAALTVTGAANVSADFRAGGNVGGTSGVFSGSINVGSISINTTGLVSGNVVTNTTFLSIVGSSTVATLNLSTAGISAGNGSVTSAPVVALTNSTSTANLTSQGLAAGIMVANSTTVGIGSNVYFTAQGVFVGNAQVNVSLTTTSSSNTPLNVGGNVAVTGNVSAISGVFSGSVNVGTASVSTSGFRVGNAAVNSTSFSIAGNSTVSSANLTTSALNIGTAFSLDAPAIQLTNSTSSANVTSQGLTVGSSVVNSSAVAVGSNVYMNASAVFVGNSTSNVVLGTNGIYSISLNGNTYIGNNLKIDGNFFVNGTTTFSGTQVSNSNFNPQATQQFNLGNTSNRWDGIFADYIDLYYAGYVLVGNSTAGNTVMTSTAVRVTNSTASANHTLSGFAVGVTNVVSTGLTVGSNVAVNASAYFIGNSTVNTYQTASQIIFNSNSTVNGTINATAYTGTAYLANSATFLNGIAAAAYVQNTDSRTLSGNLYFTGANNYYLFGVYVGANVAVNTAALTIGNSTVNATVNSSTLSLGTTTVNSSALLIGSNVSVNAAAVAVGNTVVNSTVFLVGNSTVFSQINSTAANVQSLSIVGGLTVGGNATISGNLAVTGNVLISGNVFTVNAATLDVQDVNITVAKGAANSFVADGGGITVDGAGASWTYLDAQAAWQANRKVVPSSNNVLDLGSTTNYWNNVYSNNVLATNVSATSLTGTLQTTSQPNITANNSTNFAGQSQSFYANVSSPSFSTSITVGGNVVANSTALSVGNSTVNSVVNSTVLAMNGALVLNSTSYVGTSNNTVYLGGKTEGNLNVNSALTSNNTTYVNGKTEGNLNVNSAINANNANYLSNKLEIALNVNSALTSNNTTYLSGQPASAFANTSSPTFSTSISVASGAVTLNASGAYILGTVNTATLTSNGLSVYANTAAILPVGNNAQRPAGQTGMLRYNSDINNYEMYTGSLWSVVGTGANLVYGYFKGGANVGDATQANNIFRVNGDTLYYDTTISAGENAQATGPLTINSGITLTVDPGARVSIV